MKLPFLLASDLHLTASPETDYRWGLFPWLAEQCVADKVKSLCLLGDLTDAKDYHPAQLSNRLVREVEKIKRVVENVYILMGNHDYLKGGHPYFKFLEVIPGVHVITEITEDTIFGPAVCFLPHTKNPARDWAGRDFSHFNYLFMHQTVSGAIASNGQEMEGERMPPLDAGKVYSGDIHVPQTIGPVEYVGSPYHVHFGDAFKPRCIVIDRNQRAHDLHFETISRISIKASSLSDLRRLDVRPGDQLKVTLQLDQSEKHEWLRLRREVSEWATKREVILAGIKLEVRKPRARLGLEARKHVQLQPAEILKSFVEADDLGGEMLDAALDCVENER